MEEYLPKYAFPSSIAFLMSGLLSMSHLSLNAEKYVDRGNPVFGCAQRQEHESVNRNV